MGFNLEHFIIDIRTSVQHLNTVDDADLFLEKLSILLGQIEWEKEYAKQCGSEIPHI